MHTIGLGLLWDHTQLNVINNNANTDILNFSDFGALAQGQVDRSGTAFSGSANRYYRSDTVGAYVNDNFKIRNNLTLTVGLRYDFDGPLSEKYGKLTAFDPSKYKYVQCAKGNSKTPGFGAMNSGGLPGSGAGRGGGGRFGRRENSR
jgi:outer membrane receptor for ferrienterochelin and colicin